MRLRQLFENIAGKTAVLGWGRGMGHKGHMLLAHAVIYYANKVQAEPFFVVSRTTLVDPSTGDVWADRKKSTPTKNDPLTPDEKLATYRKVFPDHSHMFTVATEDATTLVKIMGKLAQQGFTNIILVVGEQEVAENEYLRRPDQSGVSPAQQAGVKNLEIMSRQDTDAPGSRRRDPNSPRAKEADYEEGPRATDMRKVLLDPTKSEEEQLAVWRKDMPHSSWRTDITGSVSDEEIVDLMRKAKARLLKAHTPAVRGKQGVAEGSKLLTENPLTLLNKLEYLVRYFKQTHGNMGGNVLKGEMMPVLNELEKQGEHKIVSSIKNMIQNAESVDRETRGMSWNYFADMLSQQLPDIMRNASTTVKKNVPEGKLKKIAETRLK
jgi:hypothetical protein